MKRRSTAAATGLGIAFGTVVAWVIVAAAAAPRTVRLPDADVAAPSEAVASAAVRAALRAPRVAGLLEERRWRAVGSRWHAAAPCETRCVATIFYRYDDDTLIETLTAPSGRLLRVNASKGQPPISPDEQVHAHALAERDGRVRAIVDGAQHAHGAPAYSLYPDGGVCARHRCASVLFMLDDLARTGVGRQLQVLIDLSTDDVVSRTRQRCDGTCEVGW